MKANKPWPFLRMEKLTVVPSKKLVLSLNRTLDFGPLLCQQYIFFQRLEIISDNVGLHKLDIVRIKLKSPMYSDVLTNYDLILSEAKCKPDIHVRKGVLHDILSLYIRVRSVSACILQLT